MRIELLDLFAILSLYLLSTILGEEQPAGEQKQSENAGQKIDPMKLVKDSQ